MTGLWNMILEKPEVLLVAVVTVLFFIFMWYRRLPTIETIKELSLVLNSKGGNLMILSLFSLFFFVSGMRYLYFTINLVQTKQITPDNALLLLGANFVTGTAFGGSFGALLKTMTGDGVTLNGVNKPDPNMATVDVMKPQGGSDAEKVSS